VIHAVLIIARWGCIPKPLFGSGLPGLGIGTGNPTSLAELAALSRRVSRWLEIAAQNGYHEVYVYGIDEALGERLKSQRAAWQSVHEAGGKVFVACNWTAYESMGDLLDLAIHDGKPLKAEADKYHSMHHQIFSYANPQVCVEEPETYRRNYGLLLWKNDYDGAMNYAYQHSFGHCWNDFDDKVYRDHMFTYPTVNGVIDTVQWEGFREGVNDVRYLTTLLKVIANARDQRSQLAEEAKNWVDRIDVNSDLDLIRRQMIDWIIRLQ
jgi:hypothetical protein